MVRYNCKSNLSLPICIDKGEQNLGLLITKLFDAGRSADVELAAKDEEARKRFYREFGMSD